MLVLSGAVIRYMVRWLRVGVRCVVVPVNAKVNHDGDFDTV